jgi:hypothetical protein
MDNAEALTDSAKASSAKGMKKEYSALIVAALILLIVLIAVFMCLQLFYMRKPASSTPKGFQGFSTRPWSCNGDYGGYAGYTCDGLTSGAMPSIDYDLAGGRGCVGDMCCGLLGIPP